MTSMLALFKQSTVYGWDNSVSIARGIAIAFETVGFYHLKVFASKIVYVL